MLHKIKKLVIVRQSERNSRIFQQQYKVILPVVVFDEVEATCELGREAIALRFLLAYCCLLPRILQTFTRPILLLPTQPRVFLRRTKAAKASSSFGPLIGKVEVIRARTLVQWCTTAQVVVVDSFTRVKSHFGIVQIIPHEISNNKEQYSALSV